MILTVIVWMCLLTICQCKVITIHNEGNTSTECCTSGQCYCNSFSKALTDLEDNTIVNITSQVITLDSNVTMGSGSLNNVTILGNNATVMCNNKGSVACRSCSNIVLEQITWDGCANSQLTQGISFEHATNITVSLCTFRHSGACASVVFMIVSGFIKVQKCQFLFNHLSNISGCLVYAGLYISSNDNDSTARDISVNINETLFYHNGMFGLDSNLYTSLIISLTLQHALSVVINNVTISESGGLGGSVVMMNASKMLTVLNEVVFTNNSHGGLEIGIQNPVEEATNNITISSSTFAYNINGSLKMIIRTESPSGYSSVQLSNLTIIGNEGTFSEDLNIGSDGINQGTGIFVWFSWFHGYLTIESCYIMNNVGGDSSIVYIEDYHGDAHTYNGDTQISIISSHFTDNYGSALHLTKCTVGFEGHVVFKNNSAQNGAAIYFAQNSQGAIGKDSEIKFARNFASLFGGAIHVNLPVNCLHQGVTFTQLPEDSSVLFDNNLAGIAGNSFYFSIPKSCDVIRNSSDNNSVVYIPYQFTYKELPGSVVPEISTSPYAVNLCSTECSTPNVNSCFVRNGNMLGQSVYFNATVCDYYDNVGKSLQFFMECVNCNNTYRLFDDKILLHNGLSEFTVLAVDANSDISNVKNVTIEMTSVNSHEYNQLSAVVSIELSPCHGGYIFDTNLQQCKCYDHDQDVVQCQQDYAEIKYQHWFGTVSSILHTSSLCPTYYCDFDGRIEIRDGYYSLPKEENDQCNLHRVGMACGECTTGHTLAYDSTDCIDVNNCTPGMTALVVILTVLYWIVIIMMAFGLMYFNINLSLGYLYGILFYYSIVDILLGSNLYISVGVFQLTTILSSFAKLTPQFLGKLCFVQGLSGIDQQFIHYAHVLAVFLLTALIVIAARWSMKFASIVSHCIKRVIGLLLLLAYTSLASTSFQLLRPLYYDDIDDAYAYLSPSNKYFGGRHAIYGLIAWVCGLFVVIGFPLVLFLEPFLRSKVTCGKIKPLLDQFQGCYKDQYHYFAAYYLICRLVFIAIVFTSDFDNALYYLQTAGIIILMFHVWIQPYKSDVLNVLDGVILMSMILIINLGSYAFVSSTIITLVVILVMFPLAFSFSILFYFSSAKLLSKRKNQEDSCELQEIDSRYVIRHRILI